jgi:hypothetical protein
MTTLLSVPTSFTHDVSIPLVRPSSIDLILTLLNLLIERDATRGQLVLFVTDIHTNLPLAGVTVQAAGAQTIAYATNGTWSDLVDSTGPLGQVLLGNVTAESLPGSATTISFSGATIETTSIDVRVAADAATVVLVAL